MFDRFFQILQEQPPGVLIGMIVGVLLACGLGLPMPEDIILVTTGYLAYLGKLDMRPAIFPAHLPQGLALGIVATFAGVIAGDSIIFTLGRRFGPHIIEFPLIRKIATRERVEAAEYYFEKYGTRFIFVGRFMAGVRAPMFLTAGILRVPYRKFILYDGMGALISVPLLVYAGYYFGEDIDRAFHLAREAQQTVLYVLAAAGGFFGLRYLLRATGLLGERVLVEPAARKFEAEHPVPDGHVYFPGETGGGKDRKAMSIFKAYDIRGVVPDELNEELAGRIGSAIVDYLKVDRIVVGRDVRTTGETIFNAFAGGARLRGADVYDIGRATTPLLNFTVGQHGFPAGVMITASHNPPRYNGFKICRANAVPVYDREIRTIGEMATAAGAPAAAAKTGRLIPFSSLDEYYGKIRGRVRTGGRRLKVVVDMSNGAATTITPASLKDLPHDIVVINGDPDGTFPNHEPDPLKEENLEQCRRKLIELGADMGAVYDGDADRLVFLDETGRTVTGDLTTLLIALDMIGGRKGELVLYDVRSSWVVREELEKAGARSDVCRVGHAFIKTAMRERDALCAGELSGHYYFRDNFYAENTDLALVLMLNQLAFSAEPMSRIVGRYRRYHASGEINSEVADKAAIIASIKERYGKAGKVTEVDGLTVEFDDWWFNLRASNTESLLRLNVEAKAPDRLEEKTRELLALIRG
ncbi:MAG: VTT domain-containing protein [Deltaproteobacteria bacterium]|nr:VTT domain-containing protein [Deltaproteobacteria bacterium]